MLPKTSSQLLIELFNFLTLYGFISYFRSGIISYIRSKGTTVEFSGTLSITTIMYTVMANSTVTAREIFSPDSGGTLEIHTKWQIIIYHKKGLLKNSIE